MKKNLEITPSIIESAEMITEKEETGKGANRYFTLGCGRGSQITCSAASTKDAYIAQKLQRDKWITNTFLQRLGMTLPKWELLPNKSYIKKVWDKYEKPVVIKPTGLTAGKGVTVGIDTIQKAQDAFDYAKAAIDTRVRQSWQEKIMIQEQVYGEDYRLLVINGKLQIATKRIPAFVTGDGSKSIKELIEQENSDPRRDIKNPAHILKPIKIDEPLIKYLTQQNLTLDSIPEKGQRVYVRKVASMSQGGITQDFTDSVCKEIKSIVETIATSMHAFTLGVDVMCKDISKPLTKSNGAILEVNTMPETYLNMYPVLGTQREYVADIYIGELLKENKCKRFVVVGQSNNDVSTLLRKKNIIKENENVGELIDDRYLINGIEINRNLTRWRATEAIKCNAYLDTIILHYRNWNEVIEHGLGFDYINLLCITKDLSNDKENMKIVKRYKKKKLIDKIKILK
jgi:cyanophycin synthetase